MTVRPRDILDFWFGAGPDKWFAKDDAFDAEIKRRFSVAHGEAVSGKLDEWLRDAQGALALVILLDQFSRNLFRNDHRAWVQDAQALAVAREAIRRRFDVEVPVTIRKWFYMPFMHSEEMEAQTEGLAYFATRLDEVETLKWAEEHADIIRRFGRYPHRNAILGRRSTPDEQNFLDAGGFAG